MNESKMNKQYIKMQLTLARSNKSLYALTGYEKFKIAFIKIMIELFRFRNNKNKK